MKIIIETKEQLHLLCKKICFTKHNFYKKNIDLIENRGAIVKLNYSFYHNGKYNKYHNLTKRCALMICVSVYPATISLSHAERMYVCQNYYSKIGTINQIDATTYELNMNEREDKGLTLFFKKYEKRLVKKTVEEALQHRVADVITNLIFPKRIGSSFNKTYRGLPIKSIIIIVLLTLLILLRIIIPTGYHPSLK